MYYENLVTPKHPKGGKAAMMSGNGWRWISRRCYPLVQRIGQEECGANMVIFAIGLVVMMGLGGIAIDGSNAYFQQQRMQIAADAAALGGARALANGRDTLAVDQAIRNLGQANGAETVTWNYISDGRGVHVEAARDVPTWFARIYGHEIIPVHGNSEAQYETITATDNLFPMTFSCNCINGGESSFVDPPPADDEGTAPMCPLLPIAVDEQTVIGRSPGEIVPDIFNGEQPGNFGWLSWTGETSAGSLEDSLTPPGTSNMYINPDTGEQFPFSLTDYTSLKVMGLTGVDSASGVRDELDGLLNQDVLVPLWRSTAATGSNTYYEIVGFAMVRLLDYNLSSKWIRVQFIGIADSCAEYQPGLVTVNLGDSTTSRYDISFIEKSDGDIAGDTWTYKVRKLWGNDLDTWGLELMPSCTGKFVNIVDDDMGEARIAGNYLLWDLPTGFTEGEFTFTLDNNYVSSPVNVTATTGGAPTTASLTGPDCLLTSDGQDTSGGGGTGSSLAVCLPAINFETDDSGGSLVSGDIIDNEWSAWGVHVTTNNPTSHPAMIFDSSNPTGGDPDLGTPNQDFGGPGVGAGGRQGEPGENGVALGNTLIISEDNDPSDPDDNGSGGRVIFTFDIGVRMDEVQIVDIADMGHAGTVRAYSDLAGNSLLTESWMLGLGENSFQTVPVNATGVRRLEVNFPASGSIPAIISCRNQPTELYRIGDVIWDDADGDGLQDDNEPGIADVVMELYVDGQAQLVGRTRTNSRGIYRFENLPPGDYLVKIALSNFEAGGRLENSVLTNANVGSDTHDSDFNGATMTAQATVPLAGGDDLTIDGGILLASAGGGGTTAPDRVTVDLNDSQGTQFEIRLVSQVGRTWTYSVREVSGRNLSYWSLGIDSCLDHIEGSSPGGALLGPDSVSGFPGIKWSVSSGFTEGQFSFTLDNDYALGEATVLAVSNRGGFSTIKAPDCSVVEDDATGGTGDNDDSCNFRWLDWDGSTGTNLELADNINDTRNSGSWRIGRVISPGPAVANSTLVAAALNNRVGDEFVIPLTEWTGAGYQVCGFAQVRLLDYDLSTDPVQMSVQFLKGMARSGDTDSLEIDYGARDVVFVD